jgi:hypothetical protein
MGWPSIGIEREGPERDHIHHPNYSGKCQFSNHGAQCNKLAPDVRKLANITLTTQTHLHSATNKPPMSEN